MKTEIIRISNQLFDEEKIKAAAEIIKNGGLVVFPTETVYGLGADGTNPVAAEKIYRAKGRPSDNPLIIHIAEPSDAEKYAYTQEVYYDIAKRFMPGPITVIMRAKDTVPMQTRGGLDTVAVRCPSHPIAHALILASGTAVAAPSANLSGSPSPTSARHVIDDLYGRVDMIIDGGEADFGLESTIVKIEDDNTLTLLRPGKITPEDLSEIVPLVKIADAVTSELREGEIALSPGMKYRHYAPKSPLVLLNGDRCSAAEYIEKNSVKHQKIALVTYIDDMFFFKDRLPQVKCYDFGDKKDMLAQAHNLFSILRDADKENFDIIYAPMPDTCGIGLALYNRMIRAAAHKVIKLDKSMKGQVI